MALDGITIRKLVKELDQALTGGQIQKINQLDSQNLYFIIRKNGKEIPMLYSESHPFPHLRTCIGETPLNPETPSSFCMLLRKHLIGGRIGEIKQLGWDRIIEFTIDFQSGSRITSNRILIELTGRLTNFILLNQDQKILDAFHRIPSHKNLYRTIMPNQSYQLPPPQEKCPPDDFDVNRMVASFYQLNAEQPIGKTLQLRFDGLGPDFISEICFLSQIDSKVIIQNLAPETLSAILETVQHKIIEIKEISSPHYYLSENHHTAKITSIYYHSLNHYSAFPVNSISEAIEKIVKGANTSIGPKNHWLALVEKELKRLHTREKALREDQKNWLSSPPYQLWGDLLMIYLNEIPQWIGEVSVANLFDENDPTTSIIIPLNPNKSPLENANSYYHIQQRANRAQSNIEKQLDSLSEELAYFESLQHHIDNAQTAEELDHIRSELLSIHLLRSKNKIKQNSNSFAQFLTYTSPSGFPIWVGKNNLQNDQLTLKKAQPYHYWFHTQKIPGSHVILALPKNIVEEEIREDLLFSAKLAAHFSKAKNSSQVPVDYVQRKHIWKPNGAKPGFVLYESQKTLTVSPQEPPSSISE